MVQFLFTLLHFFRYKSRCFQFYIYTVYLLHATTLLFQHQYGAHVSLRARACACVRVCFVFAMTHAVLCLSSLLQLAVRHSPCLLLITCVIRVKNVHYARRRDRVALVLRVVSVKTVPSTQIVNIKQRPLYEERPVCLKMSDLKKKKS